MVRKITLTSGGWRKSVGTANHHDEFERSASRALVPLASTVPRWRDIAIRKLTEAPKGRPLAPAMLDALRTFARELVELETAFLSEPTAGPREPIEAVAHRRWLCGML